MLHLSRFYYITYSINTGYAEILSSFSDTLNPSFTVITYSALLENSRVSKLDSASNTSFNSSPDCVVRQAYVDVVLCFGIPTQRGRCKVIQKSGPCTSPIEALEALLNHYRLLLGDELGSYLPKSFSRSLIVLTIRFDCCW